MSWRHDKSLIATYNSLLDPNLASFFSSKQRRRHLYRAGLITKSGELVSEETYNLNIAKSEHKHHAEELLASAIVEQTLSLQRQKQRDEARLEETALKRETVWKIKTSKSSLNPPSTVDKCPYSESVNSYKINKYNEELTSMVKQLLQKYTKNIPSKNVKPAFYYEGHSTNKPSSISEVQKSPYCSNANKMSGKGYCSRELPVSGPCRSKHSAAYEDGQHMPHPPRVRPGHLTSTLPNLHRCHTAPSRRRMRTISKRSHSVDSYGSNTILSLHNSLHSGINVDTASASTTSAFFSPYLSTTDFYKNEKRRMRAWGDGVLDVNSNHIQKTKDKEEKQQTSQSTGRLATKPIPILGDRTKCRVEIRYFGSRLKLRNKVYPQPDDVEVWQQPASSNSVRVYQGQIAPEESFHFTSLRRRGHAFSLTFFVNGRYDSRISCCCEYKHKFGSRIGGVQGRFGLVQSSGSSPCYKCRIPLNKKRVDRVSAKKPTKRERPSCASKRRGNQESVGSDGEYADDFEDVGESKEVELTSAIEPEKERSCNGTDETHQKSTSDISGETEDSNSDGSEENSQEESEQEISEDEDGTPTAIKAYTSDGETEEVIEENITSVILDINDYNPSSDKKKTRKQQKKSDLPKRDLAVEEAVASGGEDRLSVVNEEEIPVVDYESDVSQGDSKQGELNEVSKPHNSATGLDAKIMETMGAGGETGDVNLQPAAINKERRSSSERQKWIERARYQSTDSEFDQNLPLLQDIITHAEVHAACGDGQKESSGFESVRDVAEDKTTDEVQAEHKIKHKQQETVTEEKQLVSASKESQLDLESKKEEEETQSDDSTESSTTSSSSSYSDYTSDSESEESTSDSGDGSSNTIKSKTKSIHESNIH